MLTYTDVKDPVYGSADQSSINCQVKFSNFADYVPFSAIEADSQAHGQQLYAEQVAGKYGDIGPYVPPPQPTAEQIANAQASQKFTATIVDLISPYSAYERESWAQQLSEAQAVLADPKAATPLLTPLASARGITVAALAQKVIDKATAYSAAYTKALATLQQSRTTSA